jgi:cbb3-type cytochrome oxidase subunit 3
MIKNIVALSYKIDVTHIKRGFISLGYLDYVFGSLFIIFGLICILFIKRANNKAEQYRARQLELYIQKNPKDKNITYKQTKMYLPAFEKAKQFMPSCFAIVFFILGIAFLFGQPISLI